MLNKNIGGLHPDIRRSYLGGGDLYLTGLGLGFPTWFATWVVECCVARAWPCSFLLLAMLCLAMGFHLMVLMYSGGFDLSPYCSQKFQHGSWPCGFGLAINPVHATKHAKVVS